MAIKEEDFIKALPRMLQHCTVGILNNEQAFGYANHFSKLVTIRSGKAKKYFFTDQHIFGYGVLPSDWVAVTMVWPYKVSRRQGCEDGIIDTIEKYKAVFGVEREQITSMKELLAHLNGE